LAWGRIIGKKPSKNALMTAGEEHEHEKKDRGRIKIREKGKGVPVREGIWEKRKKGDAQALRTHAGKSIKSREIALPPEEGKASLYEGV